MNTLATTNIIIIILLLSAIESTYCYLAVLTSSPIQPSPLQLISSPRRLQQAELSDFDCVNASSLDDCLLPDYYCGSNFTDGVCQLCNISIPDFPTYTIPNMNFCPFITNNGLEASCALHGKPVSYSTDWTPLPGGTSVKIVKNALVMSC